MIPSFAAKKGRGVAFVILLAHAFAVSAMQTDRDSLVLAGTVMLRGTRQPVSGVRVRLLPATLGALQDPSEAELAATTSDVSGRFRFLGLAEGSYFVDPDSLDLRRRVELIEGQLPLNVELWSERRAVVSGRVVDSDGSPIVRAPVDLIAPRTINGRSVLIQNVEDILQGPPTTDDDGYFSLSAQPGDYYLLVRLDDRGSVFYPGVSRPDAALPLSLRAGTALSGLDVRVSDEQLFGVRFEFVVPEFLPGLSDRVSEFLGDSMPLEVWIRSTGRVEQEQFRLGLRSEGEGVWLTAPLPPGAHELQLMYTTQLIRDVDWAEITPISTRSIVIEDSELDLGVIAADPKVDVVGRVRIDPRQADYDVSAVPEFRLVNMAFAFGARVSAVASDGTLLWEDVSPGSFLLRSEEPLPRGLYVQSARSGGRDLLREPLLVGGTVGQIDIVLAVDGGSLEGTARNPNGELVPDAMVVLIPSSSVRSPYSRFPAARANESGAYLVEDVPPGEYRVVALDLAGMQATYPFWEDPEFLREYERRGDLLRIEPSARVDLDLEAVLSAP